MELFQKFQLIQARQKERGENQGAKIAKTTLKRGTKSMNQTT